MKYWLLTTEYPPFFGGGISTYCYQTATMLAAKGHAVTVFVNDFAVKDFKVEQRNGVRIILFNPSQTNSSSFLGHDTYISYEFAHIVKQFIEKEGKPDIIEAQEYLGIGYYLLQYKFLLYDWCKDVPVLITMHSPSVLYMDYNHISQYRYPNYWVCEMERFCLCAADHIISPSKYMVNELDKKYMLGNKEITIISNPYEIKTSQSDFETFNPGQIAFYGKHSAQKGSFQLLSYFKQLWDNGFSRPLYLIGSQDIVYHPEGKSMGGLIKKKYQEYIHKGLLKLEDKILPSEIAARLAKVEVVIIPSNNDNLPYVVLEMMGLGKIILVSRQGGQSEVVQDDINGFVFDHEEPKTFSRQLEKILQLEPSQRNLIAANAIRKIKDDYSHATIYHQKIKVLEKLITDKTRINNFFPFVKTSDRSKVNGAIGKKDRLSIVVPYFNMGKYIDETMASIKSANYPDTEIIIVNDGSTDTESIAKLSKYRSMQSVRIFDTDNRGLAAARNFGANNSDGEYLAFLDADDTIQPEYYSKATNILRHYQDVHFVGCWTQYFENSMTVWPSFLPEPPLILYHNLVNSSALVYKRKSFLEAGQNDSRMVFQGLEDYESVISMTSKGCKGVVIPEILFNYRVRADSMIRAISRNKKLFLYQYISHKHRDFYASFATEIFNLSTANGPGILLDNPSLDLHLADKVPFGGRISLKLIRLIKKNKHLKAAAYKLYSYIKK